MIRKKRVSSFQIRNKSESRRSCCSTDVVDFSGQRVSDDFKTKIGMTNVAEDASGGMAKLPPDHFIELVLATKENTRSLGWLITDSEDAIEEEVNIPFYANVTEGGNFNEADWKDEPVVRQAKVSWKECNEIMWLERHMEMTQGFILIGKNPAMIILGEPTHDRKDLSEEERNFPDISRLKGYIFPAGCGIIIKKGTWHDFPVSMGPDVTVFILNTAEVVDALMSMKEPASMDFGDCFKIRNSDVFHDFTLRYPDPRPIAKSLGLLPNDTRQVRNNDTCVRANTTSKYGEGMARIEVPPNWAGKNSSNVWVVPIVNVEAFSDDEFGPSIQPHLNHSQPEIANSGWRDYGKQQGLRRLGALFKQHSISCTAVVSSDLVQDHFVASQLQRLKNEDGWEIGAHGSNNSTGGHAGLTAAEETEAILDCTKTLEATFGTSQNMTWLTPGFSVTRSTPKLLLDAGVRTLLDFVDDDRPFLMKSDEENSPDHALVCLPYSLEANDFSLILTRHLSPREYAMALESHITQLAKESRDSGCPTVVCLGLHTFVAGTPAVVHELDKMLTRLKHRAIDNITWTTAEQVSTRVRKRQDEDKVSLIHHSIIPSPSLAPAFEAQESVLNMLGQSNSSPLTICATPSSVEVNCNSLGLLLIDIQNDFMSSGGFGEKLGNDPTKLSSIIAPTKDVLKCARTAGLTVIHTREGHRPNLADVTQLKAKGSSSIGMNNGKGRSLVRGEWGSEFVAGLEPLCSETIIDKPGKGSFYQTDLDLVLRNANIDTLIVCGVTTEVCVHSTVRDATDRGIRCIVLKDCTASYFDEFHRIGLEMISAQGGIFGFVSDSKSIINAFTDDGIA